jgi:hypothetical protein
VVTSTTTVFMIVYDSVKIFKTNKRIGTDCYFSCIALRAGGTVVLD